MLKHFTTVCKQNVAIDITMGKKSAFKMSRKQKLIQTDYNTTGNTY